MFRLIAIFSIFMMSFGYANLSMAVESTPEPKNPQLESPQNEALQNKVSDLLKKLSQEEASHFLIMYANYTIYSMVKAVSHDVEEAVGKCAENNKEMASELNNRYKKWINSVGSNMKSVDETIKNLGLAQNYISQAELKVIFDLVDETRSINSSRFEKAPVTTPEACEFLLSKMDETEDSMNRMLKAAVISYPNSLRKMQK